MLNKKAFVLALMLLAIPILTVLPVQAKPKQTFILYVEGETILGDPDTRTWLSGPHPIMHMKEGNWGVTGEFWIQIGDDPTNKIHLNPDDYSVEIASNLNLKNFGWTSLVRETIDLSDEFGEEATLEIQVVYGRMMVRHGSFVGHGTGALEGVKVAGESTVINDPPGSLRGELTRAGTVMGWPTS